MDITTTILMVMNIIIIQNTMKFTTMGITMIRTAAKLLFIHSNNILSLHPVPHLRFFKWGCCGLRAFVRFKIQLVMMWETFV